MTRQPSQVFSLGPEWGDGYDWRPKWRILFDALRRRPGDVLRRPFSRLRLWWLFIGVLVAGTLSAAGLGAADSGFTLPGSASRGDLLTGFSGYVGGGPVHEVNADWTVPSLQGAEGDTATWIGVQATTGAFIQVGSFEVGYRGRGYYELFWSSTQRGFHAVNLGFVGAGDHLTARMTRTGTGWLLVVRSSQEISRSPFYATGTQTSATTLVPYDVGAPFTLSEWVQEDPVPGRGHCQDVPFPKTVTAVYFEKLGRNGTDPFLAPFDGQALQASDGAILVPSPVRHDGFSLSAPDGLQRRYLDDAWGLDVALDAVLKSGTVYSRDGMIEAVGNVIGELRSFAQDLATQQWPAGDLAAIGRTEARDHDLAAALAVALSHFEHTTRWTLMQVERVGQRFTRAVDALRHQLGLPPTAPPAVRTVPYSQLPGG